MRLYQIDYGSLYVELKTQLRKEFGIEIPESWEQSVCLGWRDVSLRKAISLETTGETRGGQG